MSYIKISSLILFVAFLFASCSKENIIEIEDEIPGVVPTDTIIYENSLALGLVAFNPVTAQISTQLDGNDDVDRYLMVVQSPNFSLGDGLFLLQWSPDALETSLQNETYSGFIVGTFSQDLIDELYEWRQNGSDPDTFPTATDDDIVPYFASGLSIEVSDVTTNSASISLSGDMTDLSGNIVEVSASIFAELL